MKQTIMTAPVNFHKCEKMNSIFTKIEGFKSKYIFAHNITMEEELPEQDRSTVMQLCTYLVVFILSFLSNIVTPE